MVKSISEFSGVENRSDRSRGRCLGLDRDELVFFLSLVWTLLRL
jgi:hypothetical protein